MKQILFRGAATALVTPMQPDGSLDLETLSRLTEWQIQSSISALVPCGTTGEAATLTDEERFTVIQTVAKTAAGRVPVIAGAGCNDTARAEQNCLAAAAAGADALLLVTPYYNKCTPKGLQSHFARLASATPLPVILYNVPSRTGVTIDMESRRKLSKVDNIIGLKEASTDFSLIHQHLLELGDTLPLYSGNDDLPASDVPGSPRLHFRPQQSASPQHRSPLSGDLAERSTGSPFPALFPSSLDEIPLLRGQPHPCQSCHAACWFPLWQLPHATFPHRTGSPCITATTIYYDETTRTLLNSACHRGAFAL